MPAVAEVLENGFIESRLHNDGPMGSEVRAFQMETVSTVATPSYVAIDPQTGRELARYQLTSFPGDNTVDEMIAFLRRAEAASR